MRCGSDHTEMLSKPEDRSGGAPERSETVGLMSQSLEPKGAVPRSQAEKATEQPSVTTSRSPVPPGETPEATAPLSVKRKALTSGNLSPESDIVPKTPGGGKRQKGSTDEGTPRRILARKAVEKLKRTTERGIPSQNSVPQGEKTGALGTDSYNKEPKAPTLVLPKKVRHLELKRKLGQNKAFLPALERALGQGHTSGESEESHSLVRF